MTKTQPRKVDWINHTWDFDVAMMGDLGLSTKAIAAATGLTGCQVGYRLHKGGIKRSDYRNGVSEVSRIVLRHSDLFSKAVERHLRSGVNGEKS